MVMSKFFAAIFALGLSSFAPAQETSPEEQQRILQELKERNAKRPVLLSQDDDAELKTRILEKVRAKLTTDRAALLQRIEKIIDEELGKTAPAAKPPKETPDRTTPKAEPEGDAKVKDIERKMRLLEEQKETLAAEMAKTKRQAADEALREEARKNGPHDAEEAQEMFDNALELHDKDKNYRESIKLFKRIYYNFPKTRVGAISAYNAA